MKLYHNHKLKRVYGLSEGRYYVHVDKETWEEVSSAKTPYRNLDREVFMSLYSSFERFLSKQS